MSKIIYPYNREWSVKSIDLTKYSALKDNWLHSQKIIKHIHQILHDKISVTGIRTIAAAGSIGRMESSQLSDSDLIIVLDDSIDPHSKNAKTIYKSVWKILEKEGIECPKITGVFSTPCTLQQLSGKDLGSAEEKLMTFGKRILLLLECQPVFNDNNFHELSKNILKSYAIGYVDKDSKKEWTFLLNDLLRYFRALCVNYQWDFVNDKKKWPLRNIKLRHSRLIMYSGLLLLLGESSKERVDKINWLLPKLNMTPLERIAWVYEQNKDWSIHRIMGNYDVFLNKINDPTVRSQLNAEQNIGTYAERYASRQYAELKVNSDSLIAELMRFVFNCKGKWSERFFEYLIF